MLTTGDLQRQSIDWTRIDATGVTTAGDASQPPHVMPWANIVSLERAAAPAAADAGVTLVLADGSRLVGAPAALGETSLQWREQKLGSIAVPLRQVRSIERGALPPVAPAATDRVQFTNGDAVTGVITDMAADSVSIKTDAGSSTVPLATVQRVTFASVGGAATASKKPDVLTLRLSLDDGSLFDATDVRSDGPTLTFKPAGAKAAASLTAGSILGIEHVDGPAAWLASLAPVAQKTATYFPFAVEQPARLGAPDAPHEIEVHDRSMLKFDVDPGWDRLHSRFSLRTGGSDVAGWADATVRVRLDDRVAFEKSHVRADAPAALIDLPLGGAKSVTLETDFGSANGTAVDVRWVEPALLRKVGGSESPVPVDTVLSAPGR